VVGETKAHFARPYRLLKCERCDLRIPDPPPSGDELRQHYDGYGVYADPLTIKADLERKRARAQRLLSQVRHELGPERASGQLLEIGCGNGALLRNLQQLGNFDCYGVEVDPKSAQAAADLLPGKVFCGMVQDAGFEAARFSVINLEQVIEHVLDTAGLLKEIHRLLAPGGLLLVSTPNFRGFASRVLGLSWKELAPDEHVRMFSPPALRFHLEQQGFTRVRTSTGGVWLVRRRDRKNLLPFRPDHPVTRVVGRVLKSIDLGDNLSATARKPLN
jgi:SAM-dependent methyltransferase